MAFVDLVFCPHEHLNHLLGDVEGIGFGAGEGQRVKGLVKERSTDLGGVFSHPSIIGNPPPAPQQNPETQVTLQREANLAKLTISSSCPLQMGSSLASLGLISDPHEVPTYLHSVMGGQGCQQGEGRLVLSISQSPLGLLQALPPHPTET